MATILVPEQSIDNATLASIKSTAALVVQDMASGGTNQDVIYRNLTAQDINAFSTLPTSASPLARISNPNQMNPGTLYTDQFPNFTMLNTTAVAIWGYAALATNPAIDQIGFTRGGAQTLALVHLDELFAQGAGRSKVGIFSDPIFFGPNDHVAISLLASNLLFANTEQFAFLGYVAEQAGRIVTNPPVQSSFQRIVTVAQ
jgi:hypothetical protein